MASFLSVVSYHWYFWKWEGPSCHAALSNFITTLTSRIQIIPSGASTITKLKDVKKKFFVNKMKIYLHVIKLSISSKNIYKQYILGTFLKKPSVQTLTTWPCGIFKHNLKIEVGSWKLMRPYTYTVLIFQISGENFKIID